MKILKRANASRLELIGYQSPEPGVKYVPNPCLIQEGNAVFNPITEEAILIEDIQKDRRALVNGWYLVPEWFDVVSVAHMMRQKQMATMAKPHGKTGYTIFTTTACNAHCEYCFEKGYDVLTMSEETAHQVADYILKTCRKNGAISIKWFGGEPLVNKDVISVICTRLNEYHINFTSDITTNGDLLPKCTDEELKLWRIKSVQLTFDDVGDAYDKIKGLPGAYERLHASIDRLAKLGIWASIRIHYAPGKMDACYRVAKALATHKNVRMYCRILYDKEQPEDYAALLEFEEHLIKTGFMRASFPSGSNGAHCMADRPAHACITPNGELSPCEHFAYGENIYGNIHTRNKNGSVLAKWAQKEKHTHVECAPCPLYACCEKIVMCPSEGKCESGYKEYQIARIKRALRYASGGTKRMVSGATQQELSQMCGIC